MIWLQQNNEGVNERVKWHWENKCIMNRSQCERKRENRWILEKREQMDNWHSSMPKSLYIYIFTFSPLYFINFIFPGTLHLISISVILPVFLSWALSHCIVPRQNVNAAEICLIHQVGLHRGRESNLHCLKHKRFTSFPKIKCKCLFELVRK